MNFRQRRKIARYLLRSDAVIDATVLFLLSAFVASFIPITIFQNDPATGGDMGSHFWPLFSLVHYALPEWSVRTWNPGNLGGEPHLVHYFPFPYLLMAALSELFPLEVAFNLGTFLPVPLLPLCAYAAAKGLGYRYPAPLCAAIATTTFLFHESTSIWGGNILSVLAGQFAHAYALCLLLLFLGAFACEVRRNQIPLSSSLLLSCVAVSHSYVFIFAPIFCLGYLLAQPRRTWRNVTLKIAIAHLFALALSAWFLVPMLDNAPWTTPFAMKWIFPSLWTELFPPLVRPILILGFGSVIVLFIRFAHLREQIRKTFLFWLTPAILAIPLFFLFPFIGLVDVRVMPQAQLGVVILCALLFGELIRRSGRIAAYFTPLPIAVLALWWITHNEANIGNWLKWNYSGWHTKPLYADIEALAKQSKGSFSDLRIAYEHNDLNHGAGTERVFEMLPYFAGRSTLESVYMQATPLALPIFQVQAEMSKTPSCPYPEQKCPKADLAAAKDHLEILGVGELILVTPELKQQAAQLDWLVHTGTFGQWDTYTIIPETTLVRVVTEPIETIESNWKSRFYDWFNSSPANKTLLVSTSGGSVADVERFEQGRVTQDPDLCTPIVAADFGAITLTTECPGKSHLLKFSFHPSWKTDTGDQIVNVSPGMIGIVPSERVVHLSFGQSNLWKAAGYFSSAAFLIWLAAFLYRLLCGRELKSNSRAPFFRLPQVEARLQIETSASEHSSPKTNSRQLY